MPRGEEHEISILISMKVSAFFVIICLKFVVLIGVGNFSDEFNIISAYYN